MEHNRFVIESMSFCQGNCSGCFFSEKERVGGSFINSKNLGEIVNFIKVQASGVDDCSINFGQGDHLAISDEQWSDLLFHMKQFKALNPLITITTSAIEQTHVVKKRASELYQLAIDEDMKIFFAVVLDPKKLSHKGFKERYVENINYIRNLFGFIDLTINVGTDTLDYFPAEKLDSFLIENKFRHLELNLIPTVNTVQKFSSQYKDIINWFVDFRKISVGKPYLVFHHYHFNQMIQRLEMASIPLAKKELTDFLCNNFYISFDMSVSSIMSGYTGNALPLSEKTGYNISQNLENFDEMSFQKEQNKIANTMTRHVLLDKNCSRCEFNKMCLLSGSMIFKNKEFESIQSANGDCFLGVKDLWSACYSALAQDKTTGVVSHLKLKGQSQEGSFGVDE